ncbi:unnamed protein product [Toxocara canis]|uniref:Uncharacterized protein n=1 Tax=Toxocara canis TaxID=6265 RepID=A0A3P7GNS3_TOXCA|nr:unnamed protein product [Toxocara canis]
MKSMTLIRTFVGTSTSNNEQQYYVCGRVHPQPATFIAAFVSFTTFLFVTIFFIYVGYWYALPVLIIGSVGWILCLRFLLARSVIPFIVVLLTLDFALVVLTALFIYFAVTATGPDIFSQDIWNDQSGAIQIVHSPKRAKISNGIVATVFATLAIVIAYCTYIMYRFRKYVRESVSTTSRNSNMTRNVYASPISGHINACYPDLMSINGYGSGVAPAYGSPPPYEACVCGTSVMPPAYPVDDLSLPSYSASVSRQQLVDNNNTPTTPITVSEQTTKTNNSSETNK